MAMKGFEISCRSRFPWQASPVGESRRYVAPGKSWSGALFSISLVDVDRKVGEEFHPEMGDVVAPG